MLRADVLPKWHWRDGRTITSREIIELLDKVVERSAPVMANNLAQMLGHMFKFAIHRGTLENSPVQLLYRPGGKPRRRKRVLSEEELRPFVTSIDSICRTKKRMHVLMVLLLTMQRSVKRLLPRFLAHGVDAFVPHDLRRTGRTTLGRLGVTPFIGERVINHSKDVLEETYDRKITESRRSIAST